MEKFLNSCKDNSCIVRLMTLAWGGPCLHQATNSFNFSSSPVAMISTLSSAQFFTVPFIPRMLAFSFADCR